MAGEPAATMSKSAKRRANAKAKEAVAAQEAAQAAPAAPEPKAKAKAKAEAPAPAPKATPKAPAAPKSESKAKAGSKPAKAPVDDDEPPRKKEEPLAYYTMDDGTGGDWEVSTGLTKKQQKQKERKEEQAAAVKAAKEAGGYPGQKQIPGMGPVPQANIPGMAPAPKAKAAVSQSLVAAPVVVAPAAAAAGTEATEAAAPKDQAVASVTVPEAKVGIVIGPKGSMISLIKEKTEVKGIDVNGGVFTITGPAAAVAMAEMAITEIAQKGYCSLAFDNFQENYVNVHPDFFPEIIGKKGAVIQAIKKELGVEVKIPETQKGGPSGKKYKVTIAGKGENTEKAKEVLNDIMMYFHHEVTHPGEAHEELEIEPWQYSFVIGPKGSQLRHVQNNYGVRVHIPRESSLNQNVVIVGMPNDVTRAKANIEKILYNAANQVKGRDRQDQADDGWGDEGEEEEWMKQYMFKRR